jgi:hypothetical protein
LKFSLVDTGGCFTNQDGSSNCSVTIFACNATNSSDSVCDTNVDFPWLIERNINEIVFLVSLESNTSSIVDVSVAPSSFSSSTSVSTATVQITVSILSTYSYSAGLATLTVTGLDDYENLGATNDTLVLNGYITRDYTGFERIPESGYLNKSYFVQDTVAVDNAASTFIKLHVLE